MRLSGSASLLRAINERAVLGHLLERGALTRGEIVRLTGLSKPTASQALARLEAAELVTPTGETTGGPGRNATIYGVHPDIIRAGAVEVRPESLTAAVCDVSGRVNGRAEHPVTERTEPTEAVTDVVTAACGNAGVAVDDLDIVQIAVPGSYDPGSDTIRHVNHVAGWSRPGLISELCVHLGDDRMVAVDNDVNLAAAAERARGVAGNRDGFALLWVSAGLGLAIDLGNGQLRGARGAAGEVGYMPVGSEAGTIGDFQGLVGAPAVVELAREHGLRAHSAHGAVQEAVNLGEPGEAFLTVLARRIAVGIVSIVAVLDPPLVVLAGEVCHAGGERLRGLVAQALATTSHFDIPVEVTGVDGNPVLLGALDAAVARARQELVDPPAGEPGPPQERSRA